MPDLNPLIISVVVVAGLLVVGIIDRCKVESRLRQVEIRAKTAMPFWQGLQTVAIKKLKHPHKGAERADELLELLENDPTHRMTDEDRAELLRRMEAVAKGEDPMITGEEEKSLAEVFPMIMVQVQRESINPAPITDVQLLGIKDSEIEKH
jgi:hypothetical protein